MKSFLPHIDPEKETDRIASFLKKTFTQQGFSRAVIGVSGGIDSVTSFYLLRKALKPENIFVARLSYFKHPTSQPKAGPPLADNIKRLCNNLSIPPQNQYLLSIKNPVDSFKSVLAMNREPRTINEIRLGNIMARIRMITLFDLAKKHNALVCGTENKSEHLLGYFTRFGDAASDIEPITHLYKTQVYQLAKYLGVPKETIQATPTAGLWSGQTDEGQFGFTYQEADQVLYLYFDKKRSLEQIKRLGYKNVLKIIRFANQNSFKLKTPYHL